MHGIALNRRVEQVEYAHAVTVAVSHVMDMAFGKGKGRILDRWTDEMLNELTPEERKKRVLSEGAMQVLGQMPTVTVKKE